MRLLTPECLPPCCFSRYYLASVQAASFVSGARREFCFGGTSGVGYRNSSSRVIHRATVVPSERMLLVDEQHPFTGHDSSPMDHPTGTVTIPYPRRAPETKLSTCPRNKTRGLHRCEVVSGEATRRKALRSEQTHGVSKRKAELSFTYALKCWDAHAGWDWEAHHT